MSSISADFYSGRLGIVARRLINRGIRAALAACRWHARAGARLSDAVSRIVSRRRRALHRLHAGSARRTQMADGASDIGGARRSVSAAAAGCISRSHPDGSCIGNDGRSGGTAARGLARALAIRARDGDHSKSPRRVDANQLDAVRSRPTLFASQITQLLRQTWFTPTAWSEALFMPPVGRRLVPAFGDGLGADRRGAVDALCRRAYRRGHQTGLSRDPRQARALSA